MERHALLHVPGIEIERKETMMQKGQMKIKKINAATMLHRINAVMKLGSHRNATCRN